jgi:hypothetical protein
MEMETRVGVLNQMVNSKSFTQGRSYRVSPSSFYELGADEIDIPNHNYIH